MKTCDVCYREVKPDEKVLLVNSCCGACDRIVCPDCIRAAAANLPPEVKT